MPFFGYIQGLISKLSNKKNRKRDVVLLIVGVKLGFDNDLCNYYFK